MLEPAKIGRIVRSVHGLADVKPDPEFEQGLSDYLRARYKSNKLIELYARFAVGDSELDALMRRAIWRAVARRFGNGVQIDSSVCIKHLETFEIGNRVFVGAQSLIQGRFDGKCVIGNYVWIGPHSYFDARDLILEDYVGWGPGAKVLGSTHTGVPLDMPIIQTELHIKPVKIETGADIGMNAVILPGVTIGKGSIVGAGAVVKENVSPFSVVAGVPAKFLRWREGYKPEGNKEDEK